MVEVIITARQCKAGSGERGTVILTARCRRCWRGSGCRVVPGTVGVPDRFPAVVAASARSQVVGVGTGGGRRSGGLFGRWSWASRRAWVSGRLGGSVGVVSVGVSSSGLVVVRRRRPDLSGGTHVYAGSMNPGGTTRVDCSGPAAQGSHGQPAGAGNANQQHHGRGAHPAPEQVTRPAAVLGPSGTQGQFHRCPSGPWVSCPAPAEVAGCTIAPRGDASTGDTIPARARAATTSSRSRRPTSNCLPGKRAGHHPQVHRVHFDARHPSAAVGPTAGARSLGIPDRGLGDAGGTSLTRLRSAAVGTGCR